MRDLHGFEKREGHSAAMNLTFEVSAPNYNAPDLRAVFKGQIERMLNDSHGMHSCRKT